VVAVLTLALGIGANTAIPILGRGSDLAGDLHFARVAVEDHERAVRWYRKAADKGVSQAERPLDSMSPRPAFGRTQYVLLSIVLLASLWLSLEFLLPGKDLRDLRQIVCTVVGASGLALVGVGLYTTWHPAAIATFHLTQRSVAGIWVAGFIFLRLMRRKRGDRRGDVGISGTEGGTRGRDVS
jgi:hypothetical protein